MVKLTKDEVKHVSQLAKLELTDKEIEKFLPQLSTIIDHISELQKVDTASVTPTSQTTGLENVFRDDTPNANGSLTQDEAISGSDKVHNGMFKVDAILKERTDK
jgi:aspartyl-tRNA(Asn)/glutamyl-tRNA(Gln) amidotransferase subunit C